MNKIIEFQRHIGSLFNELDEVTYHPLVTLVHRTILFFRPRLVMPKYTSNILVENITLKDSPYWTLHLAWTTNVYINNITVLTPLGPIYNTTHTGLQTDGVDIDCSVNVTVENSYISTGKAKHSLGLLSFTEIKNMFGLK